MANRLVIFLGVAGVAGAAAGVAGARKWRHVREAALLEFAMDSAEELVKEQSSGDGTLRDEDAGTTAAAR